MTRGCMVKTVFSFHYSTVAIHLKTENRKLKTASIHFGPAQSLLQLCESPHAQMFARRRVFAERTHGRRKVEGRQLQIYRAPVAGLDVAVVCDAGVRRREQIG